MNWLTNLFGTDGAIARGEKLIDNAWFTDQEKAEAWRKMMDTYEPFKIAQRLLAAVFSIPFVLLFVILVLMYLTHWISKDDVKLVMDWNQTTLGEPVKWIVLFYFGGGMGQGIVSAIKGGKK